MAGFTKDESFLHSLARSSFLRFWSWPNLFRDQGDSHKGGDGKEICDLVVVFGEDILLFSDKRTKFSKESELDVAWSRWARKAISGSIKQLIGASRWLKEYPDRVYLDPQCTRRLPISLPLMESARIHSVVVCHGLEEILLAVSAEPSFSFDNSLAGEANWSKHECQPFTLGRVSTDTFVHVFNETAAKLVLSEFDTTKDFLSYLQEREVILSWPHPLKIKSEADIIQLYYESFDDQEQRRSIATTRELKTNEKSIDKGGVRKLYENPALLAKKQADQIGYFWDGLIESFSFHVLNGTSEYKTWGSPIEAEPALRLLAQTSRFERRILSDAFLDFYNKARPGQRGTRLFLSPNNVNTGYLFFLLQYTPSFLSHEKYRIQRRNMLEDYCVMAKLDTPNMQVVIGIAAKTRESGAVLDNTFFNDGQDFLVYDASEYDEGSRIYAEKLRADYIAVGMLGDRQQFAGQALEFPEEFKPSHPIPTRQLLRVKGSQRNKPCFCGSGIKAKNCCGK